MKILFTHLLNNYTGAPKVLETELKLLLQNKDYDISLLTSKTDGCLSHLDNIRYYDNGYRWSNNRFLLAILLALSEIRMFFFVLFHRFDVLYVNTVLPFGAAIAAKFKRKKIIYHVHEIYINPGILKRFYYKKQILNSIFIIHYKFLRYVTIPQKYLPALKDSKFSIKRLKSSSRFCQQM